MNYGSVVKIGYNDPRHKKIVEAIRRRFNMSHRKMSERYKKWGEMEERYLMYQRVTDQDKEREERRKGGKPEYTTLVIPYSYALMLSAHTYISTVFLGRSPVMQYDGRHGEGQQKTQAVEAVSNYQVNVGGHMVPYHIWLLDPLKYGVGILGNYWCEEKTAITKLVDVPDLYLGIIPTGRMKKKKITELIPGYVGTKVYNIRPQDWFPDPRVPVSRFQEGEFMGRIVDCGFNAIIKRELDGMYFNVDVLKHRMKDKNDSGSGTGGEFYRDTGGANSDVPMVANGDYMAQWLTNEDSQWADKNERKTPTNYVELLEMTVEIVPVDWGVGTSRYPEKWCFVIANKDVLIHCSPAGQLHGRFGAEVLEYEPEGYNLTKRGLIELAAPLNDAMTWLFNSHFFNVRKALNDMFIVDPSRLVMKDILDPQPGKMLRLAEAAYGQDPKSVITQFSVADVTQTHMRDAQILADMMQRLTGVMDPVMGAAGQSGRKTATEIRTTSSASINRLKTVCEYYSAMGWTPHAQVLVQNMQQHLDQERMFKIAGSLVGNMKGADFLNVTPDSIAGFFDFIAVDGTMPIDRFAMANLWKEMLLGMRQFPQLMMQYDIGGIFEWIATLGGIKNFSQFRIEVMPDEQLAQQVGAGNVVPVGKGPDPAGIAQDSGAIPGTPNVPGVGRTA